MTTRFGLKTVGLIAVLLAGSCFGAYRTLDVPVLQGDWWQIAEKAPDVSPYNTAGHNACDFTIWQDDAGDWHLVSCIRGTSWQGATRLFHAWESPSLTNTMWVSSVFTNDCLTTNGTVTTTNGIFQFPKEDLGQYLGGSIQAPHCFKENGEYHFFYSASYPVTHQQGKAAWVRNSPDGSTHSFQDDTTNLLFTMGRDVMVYDNRADDGLWYASYTGSGPDSPSDHVAARTATSLTGPWSTSVQSLSIYGNPESPFIVKRGEWYYLWQQSQVRASKTLTNFTEMVTDMGFGWKWAPEVVELGGQEYIATYGNGINVSKFGWVSKEVSDADLVKMWGDFDEPAFNSTNTVYLGTELNSKTTVSYSRFLPAQETSTQTVTVFNASNPSGAPVAYTLGNYGEKNTENISIDPGENRIEFQITAEDGQQKTYVVFVNRQNSDSSYDSFIVPMNLYPHVPEGTSQQIGIRLAANPGASKTVTIQKNSGDADLTLTGGTVQLTFTTSNWDTPQFITIQALSDADELKGTATFRCSAPGLSDQDIVATEREVALADDTDSDGLPDWWEAKHYEGLTAADPAATAANGINTVKDAYIAGLDPTNAASRFLISDLSPQTSENILHWQNVSGRVYSVHWSSNLLSGFQPLESNIAWTAVPFTDTNHPAEKKGFYKIDVELE